MKIKTITCHHVNNHGAMLQAYALSTYLRTLGHDVEIIDYNPNLKSQRNLFWQHPKLKKIGLGWLYAFIMLPKALQSRKRRLNFDKFYNRYLKTTATYYPNLESLQANPPDADIYIAGSDQIWNTTFRNGKDGAFYLDFGSKDIRRISYAASYAITEIQPEWKDFVKNGLSNFDAISVREASAITLSKSLGYDAVQVVDPVFLLTKEQWNDLIDNDTDTDPLTSKLSTLSSKYILVYDFMRDGEVQAVAEKIAKGKGLMIYSLYGASYADKCFYYSNPLGFIRLIRGAECIVSDSFHGTAFSIIFQKNFFVVNRSDGLNTRMQDLLKKYNLSERLVSKNTPLEILNSPADYSKVKDAFQQDNQYSQDWLKEHLNK